MEGPRKRKRASKPKVRTGCITCKIRRVKCDERKPECERCTSTGRKCDGYALPEEKKSKESKGKEKASPDPDSSPTATSQTSTTTTIVPRLQLAPYSITDKERRALEFFYHETAPQLSGFFSRQFWTGSLQRLSLAEPSVRYATVALSLMHMDESFGGTDRSDNKAHQTLAIECYNKSINCLLQKAKTDPDATSIFAMVCIIFICLEFFRGNVDASLVHIESGVRLLKQWRQKHGYPKSSWGHGYPSFEADFIETELAPMLSWLTIVLAIFGRPSEEIFLNPVDENACVTEKRPPRNILEARAGLVDIVNAGIRLTESVGAAKYERDVETEHATKREFFYESLQEWKLGFDALIDEQSSGWNRSEQTAAKLIRTTYLTATIWNDVCLSPKEKSWDRHRDTFEQIIELSEAIIAETMKYQSNLSLRFSFELGIIPPLHFAAWKCRYPSLRRRALNMLFNCPRRECLFDAQQFYAVFERIMEIEESSIGLPPGQIPKDGQLPPEEVRIHHFQVLSREDDSDLRPVVFLSKPDGLSGPWHSRTEHIDMGVAFWLHKSMRFFPWLLNSAFEIPINLEMTPVMRLQREKYARDLATDWGADSTFSTAPWHKKPMRLGNPFSPGDIGRLPYMPTS